MQRVLPEDDYWYVKWYPIGAAIRFNDKINNITRDFLKHPDGSIEEVILCKIEGYYLKKVPPGTFLTSVGPQHLANDIFVYRRSVILIRYINLFKDNKNNQRDQVKLKKDDELIYANATNDMGKIVPMHFIVTKKGDIETAYPKIVEMRPYQGIEVLEMIKNRATERANLFQDSQNKGRSKKRPLESESISNKKPRITGAFLSDDKNQPLISNLASSSSSSSTKQDNQQSRSSPGQSSNVPINTSEESRNKLLTNLNRYVAFLRTTFKQNKDEGVDSILNDIYNSDTYKHVTNECRKNNFEFVITKKENLPVMFIKDLKTNKDVRVELWDRRNELLKNLNRYVVFLRTTFKQNKDEGVDSILKYIYNSDTYKHVTNECRINNFEFKIIKDENYPFMFIKDLKTNKEFRIVLLDPALSLNTEVDNNASKDNINKDNATELSNSSKSVTEDYNFLDDVDIVNYQDILDTGQELGEFDPDVFLDETPVNQNSPLQQNTFMGQWSKKPDDKNNKEKDVEPNIGPGLAQKRNNEDK